MSKARQIEFLERLANLMQEYNVEISFEHDLRSEIRGFYGESLVIRQYGKEIFANGSYKFNQKDLKHYIEHWL